MQTHTHIHTQINLILINIALTPKHIVNYTYKFTERGDFNFWRGECFLEMFTGVVLGVIRINLINICGYSGTRVLKSGLKSRRRWGYFLFNDKKDPIYKHDSRESSQKLP